MLLKFFRKPLPSVLVFVVLVGVLAWISSLFSGGQAPITYTGYKMPLYALLVSIMPNGIIWGKLLALLMVIINGLLLIQVNTKYILIKNRTHLPALFYVLLSSGFTPLQTLNPAVFAAFFAILATNSLFATLSANAIDGTFKAGFFIAIATLFYLPSIVLFLVLILAIVILNLNGIRPWLAAIFGYITPIFFAMFYYYFFYGDFELVGIVEDTFNNELPFGFLDFGIPFTVWSAFALFVISITGLFLVGSLPTQKIIIRKYHTVLLLMLLLVALITILAPFASVEMVFLFSIPSSYLLSSYFTFARSRLWPEILFIILLLFTPLMQLF